MVLLVLLIIFLISKSECFITVKCNEKYNISEWSCQDYEEKLANNFGENLPKSLSCLEYDKFQNPHGDEPTPALVSMKIHHIESFNIETSELVLDIQEVWTWEDKRLIWPGIYKKYI